MRAHLRDVLAASSLGGSGILRRRPDGAREHGQIMILFALSLVLILVFASIVVDVGVLRNNRQILVNAIDSAALAGGTKLPVAGATEGIAANTLITKTMSADYPGLSLGSGYTISYKCLIGIDTSSPPKPRLSDIPVVCDPHFSLGHAPVAGDFQGAGPTRFSSCNPQAGDTCNAVVVSGSATTNYSFGRVVGVNSGSTGTVQSAACNGPCGASPVSPVDVMVVMDRTSSMSGTDTTNAKSAANSIVSLYDPAVQWLGLGALGPSVTSGGCSAVPAGSIGTANPPTDLRRWVPIGLSGSGSAISPTFAKVSAAITCYTNSSTGTDLADPVAMAAYELAHNGRNGVRKGIIVETDGQPNAAVGSGPNYCLLANNAATAAKALNPAIWGGTLPIEVYTIGFGLDAASGGDPTCPDTSGAFKNKTATYLLSSMATQPSMAGTPAGNTTSCSATENGDGDHFYCIGKTGASTDLSDIFKAAAAQLAQGQAHLIQLYPIPIVKSISGTPASHLGGATITITGQYLSGAASVRIGSNSATSFTVTSDTSISAKVPAGAIGTVDVTVITPGGVSPIVSGDTFTYN